jgi:hypothetical protein
VTVGVRGVDGLVKELRRLKAALKDVARSSFSITINGKPAGRISGRDLLRQLLQEETR